MAFAQAAADPLTVLIDQGKYWQAHRRGDLAEQAWQKVLRVNPKQPDALFGMGMVLADRKDGSGAQQYLAQLRQVAPNYPNIDELGRRLGETSSRDQTVNDARRLAQSGQSASAVNEYKRAIDGKPATPALQLEYYQALAATPQGWDEARRGLEQLARRNADDPRYALAYAQHLTYRDSTRRDGIARLAKLSGDSTVGADAKKSWRQALLWLGARASDAPLYQAYLQVSPDDAAVKARFDSMVQQDRAARERSQADAAVDARGRTVAEGFTALDRGDLATARARFSSVLASNPNDADALGGMGVAALKQERFAEARTYLERASRAGNPARWKDALTSATYWTYTSDAIGARSNGQIAQAKALFERAIAINPSDVTAQVLLGEMLLANGDPRGAEAAYRMALRRQADNPDAIRGLVGALAAQGRGDEALEFANRLNTEQQAKAGGINTLRGQAQAAQARAAEARGDLGAARSLFEDALLNLPDDPWLRLDLARIYVRQGAVGNARSMMDGLLAAHPDMTDALYASALLSAETQDWSAGLAQLDRVAQAQRTSAMTALQHRLWVHQQADLATRAAAAGQNQHAFAILRRAEPVAAGNAELMGAVASAYVQAGDPSRALSLIRGAVANAPGDVGLQLQYAGILSATHQDAELGSVMRRLSATQLTTQQRRDFDNLNVGIVVAQADAVRKQGDLAAAYDVISPWLAATPDNPDLQAALGRMYTSAGDDRSALSCYRAALARRPDDVALQTSAMSAASGVRDFKLAESLANQAYAAAPNDPGVLAAIGRMYRAEGKLDLAAQFLQRSLVAANMPAMANASAQGNRVPRDWQAAMSRIGSMPLPGTNPFEGKTAVDTATPSPLAPSSANNAGAYRPVNTESYPQAVPSYPPPSQPSSVPYVAPYVAPSVAPYSSPLVAPGAPSGAARSASSGGYGGVSDSTGQAGGRRASGAYGGEAYASAQARAYHAPAAPANADKHASDTYGATQPDAYIARPPSADADGYGPDSYGSAQTGAYRAAPAPAYGYGPDTYGSAQSGAHRMPPAPANGYGPETYGSAQSGAYRAAPAPAYGYAPDTYGAAQSGAYRTPPAPANGYGPDTYGAAQSGAPLQPYPGQDASGYRAQTYQPAPAYQPYAPQAASYPPAPDGYDSSPWPMSPAARDAQANAYAPQPAANVPAGKRTATRKSTANTARAADPYAYAQQSHAQAYGQPYQQPYPQQAYQPYAQQPYAQQPYVPQYAQQPYIPQPPAGYAQPYYPAQPQSAQRATAAASMSNSGLPAPVANPQTIGVAEELAAINREQASTITGGVIFRNRDGENGLSNLTDIEAPIEGRIKAGNGHIVVRATPVTLDAGTANGTNNTLARFGAGTSNNQSTTTNIVNLTNDFGSQTATGVGLSVGYENRNIQADVGTTPLGFRETNIVGGLQYQNAITDKVSYSLAVARRAVTDSLLSYAGARDDGAGLEWGGVTSSGARAALSWDDSTSGVYVNAAYQYLDGKHVATNSAVKGGGGIYTRLLKEADQTLTVGANTTLMHYDKNLSYFTYGQGGYFSPQQYVILNFPVEYMGRTGMFSYDVKGSIGVQHYRQDASNYFPTDSTRQSAAASSPLNPDVGAVYPGSSKTGVSYSLNATGEYQLAPQLAFGATASFGNAYQFREWLAAVYVRYSFTRQGGVQPAFPPQAFSSPYLSLSN
ncbi:cellulose synthase subunit BcsC-related outer membrane protein [Caballeronia sp. LZ062]|nr:MULTISPECIES: cellulose synthase subunit BcsC-related outer membrane protein [unclassified Caballeronia]MDR5857651.1 cellulose synthase subunit BcsC-related outer membrane protein [Caballeronia sp. LZ050]MDR5869201.1 cellulose synthase subunit BcsC-related outer membrane protein [Caballeronia sp. LZ062]